MIRPRLWLAYWLAGSPAGRVYRRRRRWPLVAAVLATLCVLRAVRS